MAKKLKFHERQKAGFAQEDAVAKEMLRSGKKVTQEKRNNHGYDISSGKDKIEVKSAVETEYKGSDGYPIKGYVFSNMKANPNATKYILRCMSPDRSKVVKTYEIPASEAKQQTLTITNKSKYESFLKKAFMAHDPMPKERNVRTRSDQPSPTRGGSTMTMDELGHGYAEERLSSDLKIKAYQAGGALVGFSLGLGLQNTVNLAKVIAGQESKLEKVDFSDVMKATAGALVGSTIGAAVGSHKTTRR
jgi:hypothetical protein